MRKKASKLAVLFILIGTTFLFYPQANAVQVTADVTCARQDGTQQTFQIGWDNSNQFFANRGYIPRLFCEGGYAGQFNVYISDSLSDSAYGYYNGVVPTPIVVPETSTATSDTQTSNVDSPTATQEDSSTSTVPVAESETVVDSPTVTSDTPTSTQETSSVIVDTQTVVSDTATPALPAETSTVDTQTAESIPTPEVTPLPEPTPIVQPEPVVVPQPTPKPEPLPEPIPEPVPEPEPEPVVDDVSEPEEPVVVEPTPEEETPVEEPVTEPEVTKPEVVEEPKPSEPEVIPTEPEPTPEPVQPEPPFVKPIQQEVVVLNDTTDLSALAPDTPVELENGVILTAEVVIALQLLENPAELLSQIFTDPGQVLLALGSIGADMSPEAREKSEKVIISAVIAGNIATQAAASAALAAYRRNI